MKKQAIISSGLILFVLAGCQNLPQNNNHNINQKLKLEKANKNSITLDQLKNKRWQLAYVANPEGYMIDLTRLQFSHPFAYFDISDNEHKAQYERLTSMDHIINFDFGCNSFGTGVSLSNDKFIIDNTIIQTIIGCGDTEDDLKNALKGENKLTYDRKSNRLTIQTHNNYRFAWEGIEKPQRVVPTQKDLESYDWQTIYIFDSRESQVEAVTSLTSLPRSGIHNKKYPILNFENGQINYSVGCNQLSSDYKMTPNGIATAENNVSTMMSCPKDLAKAEDILQQKMQGPSELFIIKESKDTAKLMQKVNDGTDFTWQGTLKPEIKFGKVETIYLEVSPKDERCDQFTSKRCLMVREVSFNGQGIKTPTGNWHLWYDPIKGYEKLTNQGNVIRIKKYRTPPTDTMGYGNLYILDSVIESTNLVN